MYILLHWATNYLVTVIPFTVFVVGRRFLLLCQGVSLHEIMDHVGWKNSSTALHYIKLKQVVNPAGATVKLADLNVEIGKTYMSLNNLKDFSQAFRE